MDRTATSVCLWPLSPPWPNPFPPCDADQSQGLKTQYGRGFQSYKSRKKKVAGFGVSSKLGVHKKPLIYCDFALSRNTSFSSRDGCQEVSNEPRLGGKKRISVSIGNTFPNKKQTNKMPCALEKGQVIR